VVIKEHHWHDLREFLTLATPHLGETASSKQSRRHFILAESWIILVEIFFNSTICHHPKSPQRLLEEVDMEILEDREGNQLPPLAVLRDLPVPMPSPSQAPAVVLPLQGVLPLLPPHRHCLLSPPHPEPPPPRGRHDLKRRLRERRQRRAERQR